MFPNDLTSINRLTELLPEYNRHKTKPSRTHSPLMASLGYWSRWKEQDTDADENMTIDKTIQEDDDEEQTESDNDGDDLYIQSSQHHDDKSYMKMILMKMILEFHNLMEKIVEPPMIK
ncbi:hypothetical protein Tco_0379370 [Tanacetum coccineum]